MKAPEVRREIIAWILIAILVLLVYAVVESFLTALTWAVVLTIFFHPAHEWVARRVPRRGLAALLTVFAIAVLLIAPLAWLVPAFLQQAVDVVSDLPHREILERLRSSADFIAQRVPYSAGDAEELLSEAVKGVRGRLAAWSAKLAGNIAEFVLDFIVLMLAMFFLFRDGPKLVGLLRDISPFSGERHDRMVGEAIDMISVTLKAGLVVGAVQGVLGWMAFAILSLPTPVFWGVMMALMSVIPFLGAWLVWAPAAVGLLLEGQIGRGVALLLLGVLLISAIDNFLRPLLISGRSKLNAMLVFVSVLGGIQAFGLVGLVLGPVVMATAVGLLRGYSESLREAREHPTEATETV